MHRSSNYVRLMWIEANNNNQQHQIIKKTHTLNEQQENNERENHAKRKNAIELSLSTNKMFFFLLAFATIAKLFQQFFNSTSSIDTDFFYQPMNLSDDPICIEKFYTLFINVNVFFIWNSIFVFWFYLLDCTLRNDYYF